MADELKTHHEWIILDEQVVFSRHPFVRVVQQAVDIGQGRVIDDFFQVHLRSFAICVPFLTNGRVQVIRQYKHGPGRVCLGFPAGFLEEGEAPDVGVQRELLEETGLAVGTLTQLGNFVDNGNQRGCRGHYFVGHDCKPIAEPDPGDLEEFEYLELSVAEVDRAVAAGDFAITHDATAWGLARLLG